MHATDPAPLASDPGRSHTVPGRAPATPSELPNRIGKYNVVKLLGKGAMGVVYQAFDPLLERDVALKVMLPQIADDPEQKHRFEREARAVAKLMHANVVMVFDLGYHSDGSPYIAMELLKGQDLLQALKEGPPLSFEKKLSIILQVLEGVGRAHQAGIVVGTANYMSPEQVNGAKVDGRSDLFSTGCMLYELALGRLPFQSDSLITTLWKIVHEEPNLDVTAGPEYAALQPILKQALAKNPDDRYQTAVAFADALRGVMSRQTGTLAPTSAATGPVAVPAPASGATLALGRSPMRLGEPLPVPARATADPTADPTALFRLMREIYVGAKSGQLHFRHHQERRSLHIARGRIVHATSDVPGQHLGDTMVRYGLLRQTQVHRAIAIVLRDRKRLGAVLGELGMLGPDRLQEAVGIHVRETLFDVAGRADGSWSFEEMGSDCVPESGPTFSIGEMILEAARRIQAPDVVRRVLGDLDRALSLSTHPLLRSQKLTLTPTDGFLLSRIDGSLTAREVFGLIPLPLEDVERSLFALLCTGLVEPVSRVGRAPRVLQQPRSMGSAERAAAERVAAEQRAAEARLACESLRREITVAHQELSGKTHFEILDLARACAAEQVREAYFRKVKPYLPEAPLDPSLTDLKEQRQAVYDRLREAYATLGSRDARAKYEKTLDARELRNQLQPPAPPPPPQVASLDVDGSPDDRAAIEVLRQAQRLLGEDKTWDAIQLLEGLLPRAEGHSRFRAQVLLARAYARNPKWVKRAEEVLQRVVSEAPEHAQAYVVLGNIYRASQLASRALAMYRKALQLQPADQEAQEGLAALSPESENGAGRRRLFRKSS